MHRCDRNKLNQIATSDVLRNVSVCCALHEVMSAYWHDEERDSFARSAPIRPSDPRPPRPPVAAIGCAGFSSLLRRTPSGRRLLAADRDLAPFRWCAEPIGTFRLGQCLARHGVARSEKQLNIGLAPVHSASTRRQTGTGSQSRFRGETAVSLQWVRFLTRGEIQSREPERIPFHCRPARESGGTHPSKEV